MQKSAGALRWARHSDQYPMIPRRRKRERMNVRPPERISCEPHLQFVRGHYCVVYAKPSDSDRTRCDGRVQAHHIYLPGDAKGKKPHDSQTIPLCAHHHEEGHRIGWDSFDARYGLKPGQRINIAAALWKQSPHGVKYRREHDANP